jgi:hypothetical protein
MQARRWVALAVAVTTAAMATGCGGGGDNAGECFGSREVCETIDVVPVLPFVAVPTEQLGSVNCTDVLKLNGNDVPKATLAAQDAYRRGARQLDGSPEDGIACNGVF